MKDFFKAVPVWKKDCENEMNSLVTFHTRIEQGKEVTLKLAACNAYRLKINDIFVSSGPARCCNDTFRIDELSIDEFLTEKENTISIEVNGYNVPTFQSICQPAFLQAEISKNNDIIAFTSENDGGFTAIETPFRLRKTVRYSFQRGFTEAFDMAKTGRAVELSNQSPKKLLNRGVAYPQYKMFHANEFVYSFHLKKAVGEKHLKYSAIIPPEFVFPPQELETNATALYSDWEEQIHAEKCDRFLPNSGAVFSFPRELTGFLGLKATAQTDFHILLCFDEVMNDNRLNAFRMDTCNVISIRGNAGAFDIETFEPYSMKFVKFFVLKGNVSNLEITLRTFENSEAELVEFVCENEGINKIFEAGRETFKQNAVDIFMDCPSRERAGWLCDSFFMGRAEWILTGANKIERNFLENYALAPSFNYIDEGMLPMCYPADHVDGQYIPNWAMWLVLELEEYFERTKDSELVCIFKEKIYKLFKFFEGYENSDGLLENLDRWVFVDWSKANDYTEGVSYPTNMMYHYSLLAAARIYKDSAFAEKAEKVKDEVNRQSFNGAFYIDNAVRNDDGELVLTNHITEACQNYAFFTQTATDESHPELFEKFVTQFGPEREEKGLYPYIPKTQAFIGNYLRLEVLFRYGYMEELLQNMDRYMLYMAKKTGTLWELVDDHASCNHGFASHVTYWLITSFSRNREALENFVGKTKVKFS